MAKIQTSCPNCSQPLIAEIQQVIDGGKNPRLKELLLAGGINLAQCQVCGFQGQLPVPIIYHDGKKELLFTFSPPDLNKTLEEKEAALAPLLKSIIDDLKPEERKGYLFQSKAMLSMDSLVKSILMEDGITEEMIQNQQEKIELLDSLFNQEEEKIRETVKRDKEKIDREFFAIFAEIAQRIIASQDEKSIQRIQTIQDILMEETEVGKQIKTESEEIQEASKSLEALGKNLTRNSLLELVINAPSMERVKALTSMARPAMDYEFFQMFTERIEKGSDNNRNELVEKRNLMLKITQEIDQQVQARLNQAAERIQVIAESEPLEEAIIQNIDKIDQYFIQALSIELEKATKNKDDKLKEKLESMLQKIQEFSTPEEMKLIDLLLSKADEEDDLNELVEEIKDQITPQLIDYLTSIINQLGEQFNKAGEEEKADLERSQEQLNTVYNAILRKSMKMKLGGD
jgi:hypothetical protein